ncbi:AAA family ATPase [Candidatus Bathyarchaeota archaeon]|nr:AAA family ATPase [Candidatus Bathyarchaeota archaeon]
MIVKELHLKNFISYDDQTISFPMGVITIVGENGAGKTAILDGITYALFKEHSRGKDQNLIRRQFKNAEVRLRFVTRGKNYEVIWSLSRKRSATGHFRNLDDDYPIVRPGSGERTILPEIEKRLGLDKNVFMNAIYVKQGEIAKLIDAKQSERKKLIGEILGIEELEKIWEAMREPLRDLESELKGYKRDVEQLSKYEQELEEKEEELSEKYEEYQKGKEELAKLEEKLKSLEKEVNELDNKAKRYEQIKEEISSLLSQKQKKEFDQQRLVEKITELERALSELKECEPYYKVSIKKEDELRSINEKKRARRENKRKIRVRNKESLFQRTYTSTK